MKIALTREDVLPEHKETPTNQIEYNHFTPDAQLAMAVAGVGANAFEGRTIPVRDSVWSVPTDVQAWGPHVANNGGFEISWGGSGGFGNCAIVYLQNGSIKVDDEYMGPAFVSLMFHRLVCGGSWECKRDRPAEQRFGRKTIQSAIDSAFPREDETSEYEVEDWALHISRQLICARTKRKDGTIVDFSMGVGTYGLIEEDTVKVTSWPNWPPTFDDLAAT